MFFNNWILFYSEPTENSYAFHCNWTWLKCKIGLYKLKKKGYLNAFIISKNNALKKYPYLIKYLK